MGCDIRIDAKGGMAADGKVRLIRKAAIVGMLVNVAIAAAKAVCGVVFSSRALVADAVHSASDLVTDLAVVVGARYWAAPADEDHPYGHGKIEAFVTLAIAGMLAIVALELARDAVFSLAKREGGVSSGAPALAAAIGGIVSKELLFVWTRSTARRVKSTALEANAWHHRSDALSSIPVAVAVAVAWFFPSLGWIDSAGALVVSVFVAYVAWNLARPAWQELTDAQIDSKADAVAAVAAAVPGVKSVHKPRARRYGGSFQADIHVQVDAGLSVGEGHDIGHAVKKAVVGAGLDVDDVVVHIEPLDEPSTSR